MDSVALREYDALAHTEKMFSRDSHVERAVLLSAKKGVERSTICVYTGNDGTEYLEIKRELRRHFSQKNVCTVRSRCREIAHPSLIGRAEV